jgi:cyanophycin synthetase
MPADGAAPAAPLPVELRVLTGPNLYFPGPAVKLTLDARPALDADAGDVLAWRRALRMLGTSVGLPGSAGRHAAAAQIAATVVRRSAARIHRRVPAVGEVGDGGTVIAAFPFRRRGTAEALGAVVARTFADITDGTVSPQRALQRVGSAMAGHDPGEEVAPLRPRIPVIAVTGTNGKTTTTRLIAHLMAADGQVPGWSSTDGIVIAGRTVETGDWSGPGGAGRVLADPSVTVAVTETARGGILLRGVGTAFNDVSVVTNVSADHLGLLGIHTVQQLARVKSVVPRITRPTGWAVLNADDDLVLAMRTVTRARPWLYSTDPTNPHLAEALDAGGRAMTVLDGIVVVLRRGLDPIAVGALADMPLTLAGASRANVANVLAATAAALGAGASMSAVRAGLSDFAPDAEHNDGRLNLYSVGSTTVLLDMAHNEASLASLLQVAGALRVPGGVLAAVVSTAGDRSDQAIHAMGALAAGAADRMVVAGKQHYLRGRAAGELEALWRAGAAEAGVTAVPTAGDEVAALGSLLEPALPDGSVVAVCALEQRAELAALIRARGGHELSPAEVAARVASARGAPGAVAPGPR